MSRARTIEIDAADAIEACFEQGFTDGLPVVPPTTQRVERMLAGTSRDAGEVVGLIPPNYCEATVEKIAINAVMAGCRPDFLPVVLAGVEAMCEDRFCLHGVQATTHFAAPLFIINGPVREKIGINSGPNVFGQGWRANATIGRALRLVMVNVGGARPGEINKSTLGHPGKYTYCIGENEEESPWEPLSVERGVPAGRSALTVFAAEGPVGISDHYSRTPEELVASLARSMGCLWNHKLYPLFSQVVLVLCPEHAKDLASRGWTKADVKRRIFEVARRPAGELSADTDGREVSPLVQAFTDVDGRVPKFMSEDHILVVVAGGTAGRFSAAIPGWVGTPVGSEIVTRAIGETDRPADRTGEESMSAKITLYTKTGCPYCAAKRKELTEKKLAFVEINLTERPEVIPEVLKLTGGERVVPVIVEGKSVSIAPEGG